MILFDICVMFMFILSKRCSTRIPHVGMMLGLLSSNSLQLALKVQSKVGLSGCAYSFKAYWAESFCLLRHNGGSSASACRLSTGEVLKAPRQILNAWF